MSPSAAVTSSKRPNSRLTQPRRDPATRCPHGPDRAGTMLVQRHRHTPSSRWPARGLARRRSAVYSGRSIANASAVRTPRQAVRRAVQHQMAGLGRPCRGGKSSLSVGRRSADRYPHRPVSCQRQTSSCTPLSSWSWCDSAMAGWWGGSDRTSSMRPAGSESFKPCPFGVGYADRCRDKARWRALTPFGFRTAGQAALPGP
jgi:hypothetical protein